MGINVSASNSDASNTDKRKRIAIIAALAAYILSRTPPRRAVLPAPRSKWRLTARLEGVSFDEN